MQVFADFLAGIENLVHKARTEEILTWVKRRFPQLEAKIAWNQPVFTDHGTYIIGFSIAKQHLAVAPERVVIDRFIKEIADAGYERSKELIRIRWDSPLNFSLLEKIIEFNILDEADCTTFWRKDGNP